MGIETLPPPERLKEDAQHLKEWMSKQPHLPKVDDEEWLIAILHGNKYSLEKTKSKLDNYFFFRAKYPEILKNRDPLGSDIAQAMSSYKIVLAEKLSKDGELVLIGQMQPDTSIFDMISVMKMFFMIFDTVYLENDRHLHVTSITDCRHLSYVHFLKALPWFKLALDIFLTGYSGRVKSLHIINAPAHLDKVVNTIRGFFPKKIADRFYVHSTEEDLFKALDENVVSSDFGGKGPSLAELERRTMKQLEKHREWFLQQDNVCAKEELRRKTENEPEDMNGSFRKLAVD